MDAQRPKVQQWLAISLAVAGIMLCLRWSVWPATQTTSYGFASYYTAAQMVRDNVETDRFYENRWFLERSIEEGFVETPDIFFINPPPTALILLPLSSLSPAGADLLWTLINVALIVLAIALVFKTLQNAGLEVRAGSTLFWALVALAAVYNPIWENFRFGQVYVLLLVLLSLAMGAYVCDQGRRLGVWLGLMFALKSAGSVLWVLLLLDRRFRSLGWGFGTIIAVGIIASPLLGFDIWWEYLQRVPGLFDQPWSGVTAYQTTTSFIHHNLHIEPRSNAMPILDLPGIAAPLSTAINLALLGLAALAGWVLQRAGLEERKLRLARFGLMSALLVPLQPLGEEHHYVLALPAVLSAICLSLAEPAGQRRELMLLLATLGTLFLAAPLQHTHPSLAPGFRALLAYPKLYGGLLIAGTLASYLVIAPAGWSPRMRTALARLPAIVRPSRTRQPAS